MQTPINFVRFFQSFGLAVCLSSCTAAYTTNLVSDSFGSLKLKSTHSIIRSGDWVLPWRADIALAKACDAEQKLHRSHLELNRSLENNVKRFFPASHVINQQLNLPDAIAQAKLMNKSILLYPRIISLDNNRDSYIELLEGKTLHNGKSIAPDRARWQLLVLDLNHDNLLDLIEFEGESGMIFGSANNDAMQLFEPSVQHALSLLTTEQRRR
ncbi:MAG: hypothetical protein ACI93R_000565 [Flavobacteriales bacterium]|jgi:hypothetical protein